MSTPAIPNMGGPTGENDAYPDALTPWTRGYEREGIGRKFDVPAGGGLLDTLDDPAQLIAAANARGHDLSVAEVLLSEMLAHMRADVHRRRQSLRTVGVNQSASGYTKIAKPSVGNQYLKLVTVVLTIDAAGTFKFVNGDGETVADPGLQGMGAMTFAQGGGFALTAAEPEKNPLAVTSPGLSLGIVSATGKVSGFVSYLVSDDDQ